ncbi:MAG: nucleotide exchange factor GrpE [Clostridiales bacterium]|jgi:molecular chaperone GrpE|nr:nucleotide exchange factor GrpE [Clostridiales bacterium]
MNPNKKKQTKPEHDQDTALNGQETADTAPAEEQSLPVEEQLASLEARCGEAEAKRDEYLAMAQRVQADFENFRRRNQSVRAESYEDGAASFIKTILPVCDNLERALAVGSTDTTFCDGVSLVYKQLIEALEKRGVEVIDRKGERFDPEVENAVAQAGPDEGEPGTVADVLLKGYRMGSSVLRHATVRVVAE